MVSKESRDGLESRAWPADSQYNRVGAVTYKIHEPRDWIKKKITNSCLVIFQVSLDFVLGWVQSCSRSNVATSCSWDPPDRVHRWGGTQEDGHWSHANSLLWGTRENPGSGAPFTAIYLFIYLFIWRMWACAGKCVWRSEVNTDVFPWSPSTFYFLRRISHWT